MIIKHKGELEIDSIRGVIYFHDETGITLLRICQLPKPINVATLGMIDITHMHGVSYNSTKQSQKAQR